MILIDIHWAKGIGNILKTIGRKCMPLWEWFYDEAGFVVVFFVLGVFGIALGVSSCCSSKVKQAEHDAKYGLTDSETDAMIANTTLLKAKRKHQTELEETKSRVTKAMNEQPLNKADPINEEDLVTVITCHTLEVYEEAVNREHGEWVIIDNKGNTAFRWKKVKIENAGWKWFGWFR